MNKSRSKALWITQTALFLALLIVGQYLSAKAGQLVTGSIVNCILVASALTAGFYSGLTVAVISPVLATLIGIGPVWPIVPMIMLGNAAIVAVFSLLAGKADKFEGVKKYALWLMSIVLGAVAKFAVLYFGVVKIILPLLNLAAPKAGKMSAMFTFPQLFTALIGGAVAMIVVPSVKMAVKKSKAN